MLALLLAAASAGVCYSHQPVMETSLSASAMQAIYPPAARARGVDGQAVVACRIDAKGSAVFCKALTEAPKDAGFGDAAAHLVQQAHFYPATDCGDPMAGNYMTNIRFKAQGGSAN